MDDALGAKNAERSEGTSFLAQRTSEDDGFCAKNVGGAIPENQPISWTKAQRRGGVP